MTQNKDLGISDAITLLGIAYYNRCRYKDLKACHNRIKHRYTKEAKDAMRSILDSRNPRFVLAAGIDAMFEQIQHYNEVLTGGTPYDTTPTLHV